MNDSLESQAAPALDEQFDGQEGHSELGEMSERQKLRGVLLNNFNTRYKEHLEWVEAKRKNPGYDLPPVPAIDEARAELIRAVIEGDAAVLNEEQAQDYIKLVDAICDFLIDNSGSGDQSLSIVNFYSDTSGGKEDKGLLKKDKVGIQEIRMLLGIGGELPKMQRSGARGSLFFDTESDLGVRLQHNEVVDMSKDMVETKITRG